MLNPVMPMRVAARMTPGRMAARRDHLSPFAVAVGAGLGGGERDGGGGERESARDPPHEVVIRTVEEGFAEHRTEGEPAPQRDRPVAHGLTAALDRREVGDHGRGADEEARLAETHDQAGGDQPLQAPGSDPRTRR